MNNYVAFGIGAGAGLLVGGITSFIVCNTVMRNKYEQQLLVDVESAKTEYRRLVKELKKKNEKDLETMEKDIKSRANLNKPALDIQRTQYMSIAKEYGEVANNGKTPELHVEVISPEDYGLMDEDGFTSEELVYYADGVIVNENDEVIDDPETLVGGDFADHFGDYEDDSVYIRNFTDKIDFCILKSLKTYKEAVADIFPAPTEESEE